jgi:hypothetical protein
MTDPNTALNPSSDLVIYGSTGVQGFFDNLDASLWTLLAKPHPPGSISISADRTQLQFSSTAIPFVSHGVTGIATLGSMLLSGQLSFQWQAVLTSGSVSGTTGSARFTLSFSSVNALGAPVGSTFISEDLLAPNGGWLSPTLSGALTLPVVAGGTFSMVTHLGNVTPGDVELFAIMSATVTLSNLVFTAPADNGVTMNPSAPWFNLAISLPNLYQYTGVTSGLLYSSLSGATTTGQVVYSFAKTGRLVTFYYSLPAGMTASSNNSLNWTMSIPAEFLPVTLPGATVWASGLGNHVGPDQNVLALFTDSSVSVYNAQASNGYFTSGTSYSFFPSIVQWISQS